MSTSTEIDRVIKGFYCIMYQLSLLRISSWALDRRTTYVVQVNIKSHLFSFFCFSHTKTSIATILKIQEKLKKKRTCVGGIESIGKTLVRIILWCPTTKMLIKACFFIQALEQEGGWQKCCISLCCKVFINHFYQMKASPECLDILIYMYWSKYWIDRLRRALRRKV